VKDAATHARQRRLVQIFAAAGDSHARLGGHARFANLHFHRGFAADALRQRRRRINRARAGLQVESHDVLRVLGAGGKR
jgi:hypothetical protein